MDGCKHTRVNELEVSRQGKVSTGPTRHTRRYSESGRVFEHTRVTKNSDQRTPAAPNIKYGTTRGLDGRLFKLSQKFAQ